MLIAEARTGVFEQSRSIDEKLFAEPPKECRQNTWLTFDLSRATEENMIRQVQRWAE